MCRACAVEAPGKDDTKPEGLDFIDIRWNDAGQVFWTSFAHAKAR